MTFFSRRTLLRTGIVLVSVCIVLGTYAFWAAKVNPYSSHSWVTPFFVTTVADDGEIDLEQTRELKVVHTPIASIILYANILRESVLRVFSYETDGPLAGDESTVLAQLQTERFDPARPYVITGGHFSDLYVRNLGIFYASLLDPRIQDGEEQWLARQRITLQTVATDLALLRMAGKEYTTFAPIGRSTFLAVNWNNEPSDSVFAIVYTLSALRDPNFIQNIIPTSNGSHYELKTTKAGDSLLREYRVEIEKELARYFELVMDQDTGLIKKEVLLSGARDNVIQHSGFYDNMIAWATAKHALGLGLTVPCPTRYAQTKTCDLDAWKENIVMSFWVKDGFFRDDLSSPSPVFTGEEFLAVQTSFLDMRKKDDRDRLWHMVSYVKAQGIDTPFPLVYAVSDDRSKASNFFMGLTSYAGHSIWSHLGQAYIQSLILLSSEHPELRADAQKYLQIYKENIEKYGGYPELYNADGTIFTAPISKSVLRVGWFIHYEQTKMLFMSL